VLYVDYEWDATEHRRRYEQLFGTAMPEGLIYWKEDRPLSHIVSTLRRKIRAQNIGYVVVDSIAFACEGDAAASEVAAAYKRAMTKLWVGSLHLAHITKGGSKTQPDTSKPFGSTFWHNAARSTWYIAVDHHKRRLGKEVKELVWHHRKNNRGMVEREPRTIVFIKDVKTGAIRVEARFLSQAHKPKRDGLERMQRAVADGGKDKDALRAELNMNPSTFRSLLKRGKEKKVLQEKGGKVLLFPKT